MVSSHCIVCMPVVHSYTCIEGVRFIILFSIFICELLPPVCVCVCVCMCMCVCVSVCVRACLSVYLHLRIITCTQLDPPPSYLAEVSSAMDLQLRMGTTTTHSCRDGRSPPRTLTSSTHSSGALSNRNSLLCGWR